MKKFLPIIIIILLALVFVFKIFKNFDNSNISDFYPIPSSKIHPDKTPFNVSVSTLGLHINKLGGFLDMTPENNFLVFGGVFEEGKTFNNMIFAANLKTGKVWQIPGTPIGPLQSEKFLMSADQGGIVINNLETGVSEKIPGTGEAFSGSISPDESKFIYNTKKGIRLLDLQTKKVTEISKHRYDGAFAWYPDSKHVLGYRENPLDYLYEAGKGRILAIWDIDEKTYTDVIVDMPSSALRRVEWIVPGEFARVNAGYDDGSFDYIVNLAEGTVADLGETSGMFFMGGISVSEDLKLVAMAGEETNGPGEMEPLSAVKIINEKGETLERRAFDDNYSREYVQIVNNHAVMYLRKTSFEDRYTDVVYLDFNKGVEEVLYSASDWMYNLKISEDRKFWIAPGIDMLVAQEI